MFYSQFRCWNPGETTFNEILSGFFFRDWLHLHHQGSDIITEIWLSWLIRILLLERESIAGALVCLSQPATWRSCQPDRSILDTVKYSAYFFWQNINTAAVRVGSVLHGVALREFIFPECRIFSVNNITPLFYVLLSITDAVHLCNSIRR
jgi:hypothetical protein